MSLSLEMARQVIRNCLPNCEVSGEFYGCDIVEFQEVEGFYSDICMQRCSQAAFEALSKVPEALLEIAQATEEEPVQDVSCVSLALTTTAILVGSFALYRLLARKTS